MIKMFFKNFFSYTLLFFLIFAPYNEHRTWPNIKIWIICFSLIFILSYFRAYKNRKL